IRVVLLVVALLSQRILHSGDHHLLPTRRSSDLEAREIWADIGNESGIYPACDDFGVAHLRFASGIKGSVEAGWTQTGGRTGLERSEEHTSELQSRENLVCRLLLEKKNIKVVLHL